jgi:carbon monoxide dehydrogenase subunit G
VKLEHSFTVPVGVDEAWKILLDIERIGPCMPGASIDSVDGDDFTGSVKVKLGAINLTYKGKASFVEKDEAAHRAVIDARGRDSRGNGTAAAKVTAVLTGDGGGTKVVVDTDLDVTGKVAQFGRGVMVDVGNKLIGQFADCLATTITAGDGSADSAGEAAAAAAAPTRSRPRPAKATKAAKAAQPAKAAAKATEPAKAAEPTEPAGAATAGAAESGTQSAAATAPDEAMSATPAKQVVDEQALQAVAETPGYSAPSAGDDGAVEDDADDAADAAESTVSPAPSVNGRSAAPPQREVEPINLLEHAGPAVAKRLGPPLAALLLVIVFILIRRRRG